MNLLSSLNAGFSACANGTAQIYIRGTNTRATWYASFEGDGPDSTGADIDLDAYGSALVYVNQLVDVRLYDADAVLYREYGDGYASPNIEVISPAFTGTDYVTALSAVNEPTTLQAVLNLWETNAGAPDWKVDVDGTETALSVALGTLVGLVFNVKSPAYGAVGDGVTNDQAAIAAALAAAVAAGGGTVFFPKGTYRISTAMEWSHLVSMVGVGANLTTISTDSASNARILTWTSGTGQATPIRVHGIGFTASNANSGDQVYSNRPANVIFSQCYFSISPNCVGSGLNFAGSDCKLTVEDCVFNSNADIQALWFSDSASATIVRCRFVAVNPSFDFAMLRTGTGGDVTVSQCRFDLTAVSSATSAAYGIEQVGATINVTGCVFLTNAQLFTACLKYTSGRITTAGNSFGSSPRYESGAVASNGSRLELGGCSRATGSGASYTCADDVEVHVIVSTGTVPTVTLPARRFPGQRLIVIVQNESGGGWGAITFTPYLGLASVISYNPLATTGAAYEFVVADVSTAGTYAWTLVGGA